MNHTMCYNDVGSLVKVWISKLSLCKVVEPHGFIRLCDIVTLLHLINQHLGRAFSNFSVLPEFRKFSFSP